ncbi:hypothetical protein B0J14DRAFT_517209 [Halenospora varia]|nr:hypothetical protein B0J14DRAFT_517209 [Halenospora varia]
MCNYTEVELRCGHVRYIVRSWCPTYSETHKRCAPQVVAVEFKLDKECSDCRAPDAKTLEFRMIVLGKKRRRSPVPGQHGRRYRMHRGCRWWSMV